MLLDAVHFLERLGHADQVNYAVLPHLEVPHAVQGVGAKLVLHEKGDSFLSLADDVAFEELLLDSTLLLRTAFLGNLNAPLGLFIAAILHDFEQVLEDHEAPVADWELQLGGFH